MWRVGGIFQRRLDNYQNSVRGVSAARRFAWSDTLRDFVGGCTNQAIENLLAT